MTTPATPVETVSRRLERGTTVMPSPEVRDAIAAIVKAERERAEPAGFSAQFELTPEQSATMIEAWRKSSTLRASVKLGLAFNLPSNEQVR